MNTSNESTGHDLSATLNVMAELKTKTHSAHKELEKLHCFKRLFSDDYQIDEYSRLLGSFYGVFCAVEPLLFSNLPADQQPLLRHRVKTPCLKLDLAVFGKNPHDLPSCQNIPDLETFGKKMGALYVLEGSTLGGRIIGKHLSNHFGAQVGPALNFYGCYGQNVDVEWRSFIHIMDSHFSGEPAVDEVVQAACATFAGLQQWLEHCHH